MPDNRMSAAPSVAAPREVHLKDYRVPDFLVETVDLVFELDETRTIVRSRLDMRRNPQSTAPTAPLRLDGEDLELLSVAIDGEALDAGRYRLDADGLTIDRVPDSFSLDIETAINPSANTQLSGLYTSGGNFCTQCEAEGFRRITFFPDRPDVMARYTVTMTADKARYPVLLSNGNPVDRADAANGRHWAKWDDPHPKPSYLFALVAGDLVALEDRFTTKSGRNVDLAIWVRREDLDKCDHAMRSLKAAMKWDEDVFGLEYDLDVFNIVAVSDFNMGAMENKGLNIFNTKYVLAKPDTATDFDYQGVEGVVAHEYFHNWTGNRVTCRDWFQLSLKEGLTVFRDQEFSADQGSRAVKRIADVRRLRATQFPEDSGPMAHPVRPESYIEINNFYTATVYQKGAEVVRMIHTLMGPENFRKGMDLYFQRHDNQAVTIEDFAQAMQDASGVDLRQFRHWYSTAGTPEVEVLTEWDAAAGAYSLTVRQSVPPTPGQTEKPALHIPFAIGLLDRNGAELPIRLEGENSAVAGTRVLSVTEAEQRFRFVGLDAEPVPSLLRDFSAPVRLKSQPRERLKFLFAHDTDPFARWEAGQQLATQLLLEMVAAYREDRPMALDPDFIEGFAQTLQDDRLDPAFRAEALTLPGESYLADQMDVVDPEAIHAAREAARAQIASALWDELLAAYEANDETGAYRINPESVGRRALKNVCLGMLAAVTGRAEIDRRVDRQFAEGSNMTDVLAALSILNDSDRPERTTALAAFFDKWRDDALVIDKWFSLQAMSSLPGTPAAVRELTRHPAYDPLNPNRVRSVVAAFATGNPLHFHAADGSGYAFLADQVIDTDARNPQLAARLVSPLGRWRRQDEARQRMMREALERILAQPRLSKDVFEIAAKSLA
mgnify:CR=1 FL=1